MLLLKTFSKLTNSENLRDSERFFLHVYIQRMWCDKWGDSKKSEIFIFIFFFENLNNIFDYHVGTTSFYCPCNVISIIGRCVDVEMTLFSCLTCMSEYGVNGPLLKTYNLQNQIYWIKAKLNWKKMNFFNF